MSLLALPLTYTATRNGLRAIPRQLREASYALGKTRIATIRRVLLPEPALRHRDRRHARHGPDHRHDRDRRAAARRRRSRTARRATCRCSAFLRGTGSTLTSYIFDNSPAGEGNAPQKAYAAAFVLLLIVLRAERRRRPGSRVWAPPGARPQGG